MHQQLWATQKSMCTCFAHADMARWLFLNHVDFLFIFGATVEYFRVLLRFHFLQNVQLIMEISLKAYILKDFSWFPVEPTTYRVDWAMNMLFCGGSLTNSGCMPIQMTNALIISIRYQEYFISMDIYR